MGRRKGCVCRWGTTRYVSGGGWAGGIGAGKTRLIPPMTNIVTKPIAKSIGALSSIAPPHIVAIQLKILMPLGTAIASVITMNGRRAEIEMPVVNMWWTQTPKERNPIATVDKAMALYPKIGLWLLPRTTSEMIPIAGRLMMYTAGWE